ncbi:MAG: glycosyltransferase family 4 protein [Mariniphaga sp.]
MNIAFLVHDIHFGGGGERVTVNMANYFATKGDEVTIVSISTRKTVSIFQINTLVHIDYLDIDQDSGNNLIRKIQSVFAVTKYFTKISDPIFILGIGTYPTLLAALLPKRENQIKIGCQHGSFASVKYLWSFLRRLFWRRLNMVVSLTGYDVPKLLKLNKNVCVIPNSVSFFPELPAALRNNTILSIGRIDYPKGFDLSLEVFSHFCLLNEDWKLRIIGDGPLRKTIEATIKREGLTERVSILPSTDKIVEEYLNASVFMMTSRTEGLPMVLLEAQACGLPIVAFDCETGPSEIVTNNENGYLIADYNIEKMSQQLAELASDFDKRKEFGENARNNVRKFFPDQVFAQWERLFEQLSSAI